MRTRIAALAILVSALAGCKAHMMETHGDKIQLFKSAQKKPGRGGVIRYLVTGPASFKKARQADADKQMRAFCAGPFDVTAEGPRSKFGSSMPIGPHSSLEVDQYWYVAFECRMGTPASGT